MRYKEYVKGEKGKTNMKESAFLDILKMQKNILIYGTGMVGELVYRRLLTAGLSDKVSGFVVTKRKQSMQLFYDKPVYDVIEVAKQRCEILVIIATLKGLHGEIKEELKANGIENFIAVSDGLYQNMSRNYIRDFKEKQGGIASEIDVIFMASDNNSSSGAFLSMADLSCELMKRDVNVLVVLPEYGTGERTLREKGIPYTYIVSNDWAVEDKRALNACKRIQIFENWKAIKELQELIRESKVKIIHNNTTYTYVGTYAAKRENVALVWHIREYMKLQNKKFLDRRWAIKTMKRSDRIVFISEYMRECLKELNGENSIVVYNGLDVETFFIQNKKIFEKDKIVITLVGALVAHKGQEELIRAVAILKQQGCKAFVVRLVGSGKPQYEKYLRDLVDELDVNDYVEFWGRRDDMRSVYEETDIAVVCSGIEGFGRVTVEGQLAGCLVIAADSGATVELIENGETGVLYKAGDSASLSDCIREAMEQPDKGREIASRGQVYACQNYSREKNAAEIIKIYEELVGKKFYIK